MDDDLALLAREVGANGAPDVRARYGRALIRAGRDDEAFEVLLPGRSSATVRALLAKLPAWRASDADAGRSRFLDCRPVGAHARLLWSHEWADHGEAQAHQTTDLCILASGVGVALFPAPDRLRVLDVVTGELLWERAATFAPPQAPCASLDRDRIVLRDGDRVTWLDAWTGELLLERTLQAPRDLSCTHLEGFSWSRPHPSSAATGCLAVDDLVVAWGGRRGRALPPLVQPLGAPLVGADVVVVHDEWGRDAPMVALGLRDGVERWRRPGAMHLARLVGGRLATTRRSVDEGAEVVAWRRMAG